MDQVWPSAFSNAWVHGGQSKNAPHVGIRQYLVVRGAVCSITTIATNAPVGELETDLKKGAHWCAFSSLQPLSSTLFFF